jgi:hypothetical protein
LGGGIKSRKRMQLEGVGQLPPVKRKNEEYLCKESGGKGESLLKE